MDASAITDKSSNALFRPTSLKRRKIRTQEYSSLLAVADSNGSNPNRASLVILSACAMATNVARGGSRLSFSYKQMALGDMPMSAANAFWLIPAFCL